jgi:hypothetical protein
MDNHALSSSLKLPPVYAQPLKSLPSSFMLSAYCLLCGHRQPIDIQQTDYESLNDLKSSMECPECGTLGLSLSVTLR